MTHDRPRRLQTRRVPREIEELCGRFEREWRDGGKPKIEEFLREASGSERLEVLTRLVRIELRLRAGQGEAPQPHEYLARFPADAQGLVEALGAPTWGDSEHVGIDTLPIGEAAQQPQKDATPPHRRMGDFELLERLGHGGMGMVYKARQVSLSRTVAIKMILPGRAASRTAVDRFTREAQAAATLDHAGIVPVFECGEHEQRLYYVMGYVDGQSLAEKLAQGPLPPRTAAGLVRDIALAVQYAHEHGILHRDIKPANILVDRQGQPRLTDFGLAKRIEDPTGPTFTGEILGTPSYMSPEQAAGRKDEIGASSDVYSLGATLYHLLTGRAPFQAANVVDTLRQVLEREPAPPRRLNSAIDRDLESICLKCLEKRSDHRYPTSKSLAEDLTRFLNNEQVLVRPIGALGRMWRWYHRNPTAPVVTAGGVTMFIALLLLIWGVMGIIIFGLGIQPTARPLWVVAQIAFFILCFYAPMMWTGLKTLNGNTATLWFCAAYVAALFYLAIGIMANLPIGVAHWEIMEITHSSLHVRLQFGSLLFAIASAGLAVNLVAVLSWWASARKGRAATNGFLSWATVNSDPQGPTRKKETVDNGD